MRYLLRGAAWSSFAGIALIVSLAVFLTDFQSASAKTGCQGASITILGAEPSPFVLPRDVGQTMKVEPDSVLLIALAEGETTAFRDPEITVRVVASGIEIRSITKALGTGDDRDPIPVNLKEQLPSEMKGLYEVEGILKDEGEDICAVDFLLQVGEFCVATSVATGVASVSGIAALASVAPAMNMNMQVMTTLQRRRPRGWRRYVPVPDWKWTAITTVLGAVAGLATMLIFQQTGVRPLSVANAIQGMLAGGGLTFGIAYIGALVTYMMSPSQPSPSG